MTGNEGSAKKKLLLRERIFRLSAICIMFFAGAASSMFVLYAAMKMYGDLTASIQLIQDTAVYWLVLTAVFTFIGLIASIGDRP